MWEHQNLNTGQQRLPEGLNKPMTYLIVAMVLVVVLVVVVLMVVLMVVLVVVLTVAPATFEPGYVAVLAVLAVLAAAALGCQNKRATINRQLQRCIIHRSSSQSNRPVPIRWPLNTSNTSNSSNSSNTSISLNQHGMVHQFTTDWLLSVLRYHLQSIQASLAISSHYQTSNVTRHLFLFFLCNRLLLFKLQSVNNLWVDWWRLSKCDPSSKQRNAEALPNEMGRKIRFDSVECSQTQLL